MNFSSSSQDCWETVSWIGFAIVIIGIGIEFVDVAFRWKKTRRNESILVKEPNWLLGLEVASLILIFGGLAVEFGAGIKATLLAREKIADLTTAAKDAFDKSSKAETDAGDSKLLAARIGTTNAWLIQSNLLLAAEMDDNLNALFQIRRHSWPRKVLFSSEQFVSDLQGRPKGTAIIVPVSHDAEPLEFSAIIEKAFKDAGWNTSQLDQVPPIVKARIDQITLFGGGIGIMAKGDDFRTRLNSTMPKLKPGAKSGVMDMWNTDTPERVVNAALLDCGFGGMGFEESQIPEGFVVLMIGNNVW